MATRYYAPQFVLAAVRKIYADLPVLLGQGLWNELRPAINGHIETLESQSNTKMAAIELVALLSRHTATRQRLNAEIKIQAIVTENIGDELLRIARSMGIDEGGVPTSSAAAYNHLIWEVDHETLPEADDTLDRKITLSAGGVGGGKSLKFKNMKLDLNAFTKLAAGFVTTGYNILDKPHPLLIIAGILLTINALQETLTIEVSEQDSSIFWGIIQAVGRMHGARVSDETIAATTNLERGKYGLPPLEDREIRYSLNKLLQLKAIEYVDNTYGVVENYTLKD